MFIAPFIVIKNHPVFPSGKNSVNNPNIEDCYSRTKHDDGSANKRQMLMKYKLIYIKNEIATFIIGNDCSIPNII